ncbi:hypothetical protein [Nocardia tenerifensis]|uniref:hypothetical protein n=1 Tax=Nocardia tenerifensis TaxID=228006 RepID=UPI00146140EA|nr:hypothetical protein [Nocardia tenerifensis]
MPWETWLADPDRLQWTTPTGEVHATSREGARYLFPHKDIDVPTKPEDGPSRPDVPRDLPDDIAYPLRGHVMVHRQLCRIAPDNEIPYDARASAPQ